MSPPLEAPARLPAAPLDTGGADPLLADIRPWRPHATVLSVLSAALSFALYRALLDTPLAMGLMVGLAVHEAGHLWVLRQLGLRSGPPIFVPLLGAAVHLERPPLRARDQLGLALAGPAAGLAYSFLCLLTGVATGWSLPLLLGVLFTFVNSVDLLPIGPLDGARALRAWRAMRRQG